MDRRSTPLIASIDQKKKKRKLLDLVVALSNVYSLYRSSELGSTDRDITAVPGY